MSSRAIPWILLVCLNGVAWYGFTRQKANARLPAETVLARPEPIAAIQIAATNIVERTNDFAWRQLESEDYETYIQRLRGIGCPEETIRDIIIADLEKLMASQIREIEGISEPPTYWKPSRKDLTSTLAELEKRGKKQEVDFQKREIIRELLGIDLVATRARSQGEQDFYEERLSFLTPEQAGKVRMILERANQEEIILREKSWLENDELTPAAKAEVRQIQRRKEQQVAELLSPVELEQFNLWFSPTAYHVREAFLALEPNEEDFLALYRLQREFDDQWAGIDPAEIDSRKKVEYAQAQQALEAGMREYLGEEKYQVLQNARDPDFRQLQETAVQFGLKPEVTGEVYDYRAALREEKKRISSDHHLNPTQKQSILQALNEETEQAVVEAMGPRAYAYYVRNGAGKWIRDSN